MIIVTGAAGFIASNLISRLNQMGYNDVVAVDDFSRADKEGNLLGKRLSAQHGRVHRDGFGPWLDAHQRQVQLVFHLGARTDTTEFDKAVFDRLNLHYSQMVWQKCAQYAIPLIYASSAATYGMGEHGFDDDHESPFRLRPLNPYGESKNDFDQWALRQEGQPPYWAGIKFFNVFGPNEFHKGRMASVVFHAFRQIRETGQMRLFRSHHPDYADGQQLRDFIYVKDAVDVLVHLMETRRASGLYNLGTGQARSFLDLAHATFDAMRLPRVVSFIDTPADIRGKYQYYTQANVRKLREAGYAKDFTPLEQAVEQYVRQYLASGSHA